MSGWCKIYLKLLDIIIKFLVKNQAIISHSDNESSIGLRQANMIYILPYNSKTDLLTLRMQCIKQGLPDPLIPMDVGSMTLPRYIFINDEIRILSWYDKKAQSVSLLHKYLNLHYSNPELNIQFLLVSIMFGRSPGRESQQRCLSLKLRLLNNIGKFFSILWLGRDSLIWFSRPLSLKHMINECINDKSIIDKSIVQKLVRFARINFDRQWLIAAGPRLPVRQALFNKLLASKNIEKVIEIEAKNKNIPVKKVQENAIKLMEEIAANFSYEAIRLSDRVLSWIWNRLYQSLSVHNASRVRQLAEDGHEIVYIPCHRSHIDYLLLSYVLYHQGLVPPHIAAGINLNFWPLGSIFRRLGAFFIRRSFNKNRLYHTVFREYLSELFSRGYSVEYFVEGGRSRTGRLLEPKTGTLTMTIQAMLRGCNKPITLIPIYVSYEHVIEVATYAKELRGANKKKDSLWQMLCGLHKLCKLRNLGHSYVNFGDPLSLTTWLSEQVPQWRDSIEIQRPDWLPPVVDSIAAIIMVRINNAAVINAINLCSTVLLSSSKYSLTRQQLLSQLECCLDLLRNVPYSPDIRVPNLTPEAILTHGLDMNMFTVERNAIDDIIFLSYDQATLMTYYRNNIQHLFVLPSLVANVICGCPGIANMQLCQQIILLYPLLKAELFLCYYKHQLPLIISDLISELIRQGLVENQQIMLYPVQHRLHSLQLLAAGVNEMLQRYAITFFLLRSNSRLNRISLEKNSKIIAQRLSILHGGNKSELFDKTVFSTLISTLRTEKYVSDTNDIIYEKVNKVCNILSLLITPEVLDTIERTILLIPKE